ncbi:MAG TPA: 3-hydroxyacyl-CoA dehydrogenase family protein, partial [Burkholderiaceae bacterium]|nr:3-hydroxyacyl-CoA dehydrogenase family protein [Burkholderiaceae bacterium]
DGFIGNRMIEQYLRQAGFLLDEGATPAQVDHALEAFGFAMGPFRMSDLAGNDVGWFIRQRRARERPDVRYSRIADRLCELGRFGQKTGAGWHDYAPGRREALPSPVVEDMIAAHRAAAGIVARTIGDEEIVERLVYALVNEGARILEEGIALRASDVDIVYLTGYGFPPWRGGPMWHAGSIGLARVAQAMQRYARNPLADADFWQPAPLLARLAAEGRTFS